MLAFLVASTTDVLRGQRLAPPFDEFAQQVDRNLDSDDSRTVAWAAYNAGEYHLTSTVPKLQRILDSPPTSKAVERRALPDVVLDALIQLDAKLPASLVDRYVGERPVQAFVLLTNATGRESVLLDRLKTSSGHQWFAAANVLLQDRASGLATHLLTTLRLHVTVTVSDSDQHVGRGSGSGAAVGDGFGENPPGYPPRALYRFEIAPHAGFIVLSTGPHTVYYSRTIDTRLQFGVSEVRIGGPSDADRIEYLQAMLEPGTPPTLRAETDVSIRWSTADALIGSVEQLRSDIEHRYQFLVGALVRANRLPNDVAATLRPHVDVQVFDRRIDKSVPLPAIPRY